MIPEFTPLQESSPASRPNSIFGQRFITTSSPAASAFAAASSLRTPSCIHTTFAPIAIASSTIASACREARNTSTMSTGPVTCWGISFRFAYARSPRSSFPAITGLTGMTRNPLPWRYFITK
jgi:hypothetical protein